MRLSPSVIALLMVVACGSSPAAAVTPAPTHSSPASPEATTPSAAPSASPSALAAGPACSLPFTDLAQTTGFIRFPGGDLVADPRVHQGGSDTRTYDWAQSRWLPVSPDLISPDGSKYVYSETIPNPASQGLGGPPPLGSKIHVVDIATGADTVIYQTTDVLGATWFGADGIYLAQSVALADTPTAFHLWRLAPSSPSPVELLGGASVGPGDFRFAGGNFWIMAVNQTDPKGPKTLLRFDLSTGGETTWYEQTTAFAQFLGVDADGTPVVSMWSAVNDDPGKTYLVPAPGSLQLLSQVGFVQMSVDSYGLWLNGDGIWFQPPGGSLEKVASERGGYILGSCGAGSAP